MTIETIHYPLVDETKHTLNMDAITYRNADLSDKRIMLPYNQSAQLTAIPEIRSTLLDLALTGLSPVKPAYEGVQPTDPESCDYDKIIKKVSFFLSVNIQKRRQDINLYAKITPTVGTPRGYFIFCTAEPREIIAVVMQYVAINKKIPYQWRGLVKPA